MSRAKPVRGGAVSSRSRRQYLEDSRPGRTLGPRPDAADRIAIGCREAARRRATSRPKGTEIPLATCASIAYTLEQRGYATRRQVGRSHFWRPTLRLYGLATQLIRSVDLSEVAQREIRQLADAVGMPAHVGVLTGSSVVYVAKAALPGFIQFDTYPGKVAPFNLTALGKAISAYLSEPELEPFAVQLRPGGGPKAHAVDADAFRAGLGTVRKQGYAVEDQEEQADIACVAAPSFAADRAVAGAVGVTGFARDLRGSRRKAAIRGVVAAGRSISRKLGFDGVVEPAGGDPLAGASPHPRIRIAG